MRIHFPVLLVSVSVFVGCGESPPVAFDLRAPAQPELPVVAAEITDTLPDAELKQLHGEVKMSVNLSPQAKMEVLTSPAEKMISAIVNVGRSVNREDFTQAVEQELRGKVISWYDKSRTAGVQISVGELNSLANVDGVSYVETGGHYAPE